MKLHFKTYGEGESLIVLHGLLGSLENWHTISLRLATRFQVVAVDQRNHGHSPHSQEMTYRRMAEDLDELLGEQGIARANVLGHSMGGKTAMEFALSFPDKVAKLVVVDIAPRVYPPLHTDILGALMSVEISSFSARQQVEEALSPAIPDLRLRRFLLKNLERNASGQLRWRMGLREIHDNYSSLQEAISERRRFEGPALFVRGERSDYLLEQDLDPIRRLIPRARLETIANAGHLVHVENPDAFVALATGFLV